jgi:putative tryptophan/tyrosine transport system substrate-binding protein
MNRRTVLCGLTLGTLGAAFAVEAQPPGKVYRVGLIGITEPTQNPAATTNIRAFRERLRELGWIEGRNLTLDLRFHGGTLERVPSFVHEFVRGQTDVIVTAGDPITALVMKATPTIPIVMASAADPIKIGAAESLARPGRNATGLIMYGDPKVFGKYVELLKDIRPGAKRFVILWDVDPTYEHLSEMLRAARTLGIEAVVWKIGGSADLTQALTSLTRDRPEAIFVLSGPVNRAERGRIVDWTLKHRVPAMSDFSPWVVEGLLIGYSPDFAAYFRRVAEFVDRILKGTKPAVLPIEQPTKFQLVINVKTAKALGLTIPPSILARADQVIE